LGASTERFKRRFGKAKRTSQFNDVVPARLACKEPVTQKSEHNSKNE